MADPIAGAAIAVTLADSTGSAPLARLAVAVASSVLLYWFGMASNDVFDARRDRARGAGRPIVRGELSVREAGLVAAALALLGAGGALLAGAIIPAGAILLFALLYNAGGKRIPFFGSALMGGCRALNLLLGATALSSFEAVASSPPVLAGAGVLGLYITIVTMVSLLEDREYRPLALRIASLPLFAIPLGLGALRAENELGWVNTVVLLWLLLIAYRNAASRRTPAHPATVVVRGALGAIYFVDAGLVLALATAPRPALIAVGTLWFLAAVGWLWKRRWLQSGGPDT